MLTGSLVAIVTPMTADGAIDYTAFRRLIDYHVAEGTDGLVVAGTTGESCTITVDEHLELIRFAVEYAAGRIPIIAGTGANSTHEAINLTRGAKEAGASACLSVVPYYNKPTQEGLYQHFKAIVEAVPLPLILYNVPGRTVADLNNDTVVRLAQLPNIIGLKDATGDIGRAVDLIMRVPQGFALYSGDDATSLAFLLLGGHGVISVTANVAPRAMHALCVAAAEGRIADARRINDALFGLHTKLFIEANPIPVKWAVAQLGLMADGIRLPLVSLSESARPVLLAALQQAGELIRRP
ncbi:4-hydroxy-tetrahydrodipicolinate synthase [Leeia aquatica]|uniref:4-hydroxy-tetrahydrodipicolinate synthase n=1 Tax=Leeia aquatica TaxID=2725557 RepID=A0A847SEW8_9NEIS|nr:4-hydroxy-tetrahydrodipicolinate synthase [Leeia aquatica]NLR75976.1 4-hydroxy-tetrahydrodipicolinate synthase [Leeia aquatica]